MKQEKLTRGPLNEYMFHQFQKDKDDIPTYVWNYGKKVKEINECLVARCVRGDIEKFVSIRPKQVFSVVLWSDGFEPSSGSKSNRGSVWILCVTIIVQEEDKLCKQYTYPMAIGAAVSNAQGTLHLRIIANLLKCLSFSTYLSKPIR